MTTDLGTNMEKKVSVTEIKHRLLASMMVRKDFMKLVPVARKHPFAMRNYVMMMWQILPTMMQSILLKI